MLIFNSFTTLSIKIDHKGPRTWLSCDNALYPLQRSHHTILSNYKCNNFQSGFWDLRDIFLICQRKYSRKNSTHSLHRSAILSFEPETGDVPAGWIDQPRFRRRQPLTFEESGNEFTYSWIVCHHFHCCLWAALLDTIFHGEFYLGFGDY